MASLALAFDILGRDKSASQTLDRVGNSAEKTGGKFRGLGKAVALGLGGAAASGIAAFTAGLVGGFKEAVSYQKITDQLTQTIKSTGGVAGVSAEGLKKYAGQLESLSGVDEELILSSQNVLATFTQIRNETGKNNDVFSQASLAALNMSTTLGTDVSGAAIQVGKALNDPIKGITALSKAGVSFTQQQKDQIKTLVKSGDTLGAQKIILGELNKEFGGAAEAAGKGFGGTMARLKDTVSDAFRDMATKALPTLTALADGLSTYLPKAIGVTFAALGTLKSIVTDVFGVLFKGDFTGGFFQEDSKFIAILFQIRDGFQQMMTAAQPFFSFLRDHAKPIMIGLAVALGLMFAPMTTIVVGLGVLYVKSALFRDILATVADFLQTKVFPALQAVGGFLADTFAPTIRALVDAVMNSLLPAFQGLADRVQDNLPQLIAIGTVLGVVAAVVGIVVAKIAGFLLPILVKLAAFLIGTLFDAVGVAIGVIGRMVRIIGGIVTGVTAVITFVRNNWKLITALLTGPIGAAILYITTNLDTIVTKVKSLGSKITSAASGMFDGIKSAFRSAINFVIRGWNSLSFKIPGFDPPGPGPKFGGAIIGVPKIDELAYGGIVPATSGGRLVRVAEAGRDEAVIPLGPGGEISLNRSDLDYLAARLGAILNGTAALSGHTARARVAR